MNKSMRDRLWPLSIKDLENYLWENIPSELKEGGQIRDYNVNVREYPEEIGTLVVRLGFGEFHLGNFIGNNSILISADTRIYPRYQGKGYSKLLQEFKAFIAKKMGAKILMASVRSDNIIELKVMSKSGWELSHVYQEVTYQVYVFTKTL